MRLTEAAENLKKRAAVSIRMGKENEAVDLLVQKKKLTKALESIKQRIEVLDKLSMKISEVLRSCLFFLLCTICYFFLGKRIYYVVCAKSLWYLATANCQNINQQLHAVLLMC